MAHEKYTKIKYIFSDMDGTLTRSKSEVSAEMLQALKDTGLDIFVISGAVYDQMRSQMKDGFWLLPQSGNEIYKPDGTLFSKHTMPEDLRMCAVEYGKTLLADCGVTDDGDCIQERGAQVSISLYGHNKPVEEKERFDPDKKKRRGVLAKRSLESEQLYAVIGGTTCIDIFERGRTKGDNIRRLITELGLDASEGLYIGDALFPGGNDESVIGILETVSVKNPEDTVLFLKKIQQPKTK